MRVIALVSALLGSISASAESIQCAALFDAKAAAFLGAHEIRIKAGKIEAVTPLRAAPKDGGLCTPGWIDLHVHLSHEPSGQGFTEPFRLNPPDWAYRAQAAGMVTLRAGFTTVRDLGDSNNVIVSLRNAINSGLVTGPRIFAAGKSIATTGGHADPSNGRSLRYMGDPGPSEGVINGVQDASKAVRQRYKESSDWIKITATGGVLSVAKNGLNPQFTQDEANEVVATAKEYELRVAAHAHGTEGMKRAVLAGVRTIEHGSFMSQEVMALMKERGTFLIPTLLAGAFVAEKAEVPGFYVPMVAAKARAIGPQMAKTVRSAFEFGVPIAFGTDAGVYPHGDNAREFELLTKAGVPLSQALQMATYTAAEVLDQGETLGQIATGFAADIVIVPLAARTDPKSLMRPIAVYKDGIRVD